MLGRRRPNFAGDGQYYCELKAMVPLDLATSCRAIAVRTVAVVVEENRNGRARRVSKKGESSI